MGKIKSQAAGTCQDCGEETDMSSPEVCFGCVSKASDGTGVFVTEERQVVTTATTEEVPF